MTEKEKKYLDNCYAFLQQIGAIKGDPGVKSILINALSKHIRELSGMWSEPVVARSQEGTVLIGLSFADIIQLQNGGTIQIPAAEQGAPETAIWIFLGGTEEHMRKGMAKHPGTVHRFTDSHGDSKN